MPSFCSFVERFIPSRAAALAGGGGGNDLAALREVEREALRKQARDWLRLDLAASLHRCTVACHCAHCAQCTAMQVGGTPCNDATMQ
jgi:hypothetical protein